MYPFEIFTGAAHEQIMETSKVCTVFHFLCRNISDVGFTTEVGDCEGAIGHPFFYRIFFVFDLMIAFSGHVVVPLDTRVFIVVEVIGEICVGDGVT
jgi:hypothetical protein